MKCLLISLIFMLSLYSQVVFSDEFKPYSIEQLSRVLSHEKTDSVSPYEKKQLEMEANRTAKEKPYLEWSERVKEFDKKIKENVLKSKKESEEIIALMREPTESDIRFRKMFDAKQREIEQEFRSNVRRINKASADFKERFNAKQAQMSKEHSEFDKQFFNEMMTETRDFKKRHDAFEKQFDDSVKKIIDCSSSYKNPVLQASLELLCSH